MNIKEKQAILYYLRNLTTGDFVPDDYDGLFHIVSHHSEVLLGFDLRAVASRMRRDISTEDKIYLLQNLMRGEIPLRETASNKNDLAKLHKQFAAHKDDLNVDITASDFDHSFTYICEAFDLAQPVRPLLQCLVYITRIRLLGRIMEHCGCGSRRDITNPENIEIIAGMCRISPDDVRKAFAANGPLFDAGIIVNKYGDNEFSSTFTKLLGMRFESAADVRNMLIGKPLQATLKRKNFDYMSSDFDAIRGILQSAVQAGSSGINILLYGNPGCGKTELAKSVCASAHLCLYTTSENKENKDARLGSLAQTQTVLKTDKTAVVLFDEAEDVFSLNPLSRIAPSKLYVNRRLETNPRPVIWITNKISDMDPAYIRRFSFALNVSDPDAHAKANAWGRVFQTHGLKLSSSKLDALCKKYDVPMALVDTAARNAKLMNRMDMVETTIDSLVGAMNGRGMRAAVSDVDFDTSLLNTDTDLMRLATQIRDKNIRRFSLCLYGAPGTGKTAYARYLGEMLSMPVITRRASDIKGSYVGETERNIAAAFAAARAKKAILVFDEADSFLQDRTRAHHSWEVSCVNEMLTQMESATHPFICTTNLMQQLDQASLRRFMFKVKYNYLTTPQVVRAFKTFFDCTVTDADVSDLTMLSPGDFSVVRNRAGLLDITNPRELIDMLRQEQSVKGATTTGKIGFTPD
ncbi:MAG: AAA family ATPase [Alphaproteobacteria bacterium]|nr:AAA family ATPase [Alphaproteobacteria bacterium]